MKNITKETMNLQTHQQFCILAEALIACWIKPEVITCAAKSKNVISVALNKYSFQSTRLDNGIVELDVFEIKADQSKLLFRTDLASFKIELGYTYHEGMFTSPNGVFSTNLDYMIGAALKAIPCYSERSKEKTDDFVQPARFMEIFERGADVQKYLSTLPIEYKLLYSMAVHPHGATWKSEALRECKKAEGVNIETPFMDIEDLCLKSIMNASGEIQRIAS